MRSLAFLLAGFISLSAWAGPAAPNADDPVIEQRMNVLAENLRCLVCQNESLASSHAELAEDLRKEIRAQMKAGKNDAQVITYLTDRYGDFVLYRPPFKPVTWLLWLGPVIFLLLGATLWTISLKRRKRLLAQARTDPEAQRAAALLLREDQG
jgi:cytochrome c-type biogenesis protein CcmH